MLIGQIINIPDVNFKNTLLEANPNIYIAQDSLGNNIKVDINNNGEIEESEALKVFEMNVSLKGINNLDGITFFPNLNYLDFSFNNVTSLDLTALKDLRIIGCRENKLVTLDIGGLENLQELACSQNFITSLNISNSKKLKVLSCPYNKLSLLDLSELRDLEILDCQRNQLTTLDLRNLKKLKDLRCEYNQLSSLYVTGLLNLEILYCHENLITSLDLSGLTNLETIICTDNLIASLDASELTSLNLLWCSNNQLTNLKVDGLKKLEKLDCSYNQLQILNVNGITNLQELECISNKLELLDVTGLKKLTSLKCYNNQLNSLLVHGMNKLTNIECSQNLLTTLDFSGLINLEHLSIFYNQFTSLDVSKLTNLVSFDCRNNQFVSLNLSGLKKLSWLDLDDNKLTTLDLSGQKEIYHIGCSNNQLTSLYMKNGVKNNNEIRFNFDFLNNPKLKYICADEIDLLSWQYLLDQQGIEGVTINSFCSSTLNGTYFNLNSQAIFDEDNNGCSSLDAIYPYLKIKIQNEIDSGYAISDANGNLAMGLDSGTYTISPILPNEYFISSPASTTVTFPEDTIPQHFCIGPNGIHNDVSISILPTRPARPGFSDATYKIILTNKGNQVENGVINFNYNETLQDFISASQVPESKSDGRLTFTFSNLKLFETREITIKLRTNSPLDVPPVNVADVLILYVEAILDNEIRDSWVKDNVQEIDQTVVGSFDPNDKTCLEGDIISPILIGEFVNYLIRFENKGTANAENIVINDVIDINTFDINTLEVVSTSHSCKTLITDGNKIKFIFDKIMLPFFGLNRFGYVAFKIKLKDNLNIGDSLKNNADIYFDYNLPIRTNTATSNIANITGVIHVANESGNLKAFPNPSNGIFMLDYSAKGNFEINITLNDVTGKVLYMENINHNNKTILPIKLEDLPSGVYNLQVKNPKGVTNQRVVVN